ncbi:hypothetical protein [Streptomyces sp. DSM 41634]|uniref:hypothetical protein n=1 Tax=Streptomyces sp. DSM 41634 TaxID=3448656 RepID=UPI002888160A|nr:hypothetical protein [Streptomyces sp. DSM 41633]
MTRSPRTRRIGALTACAGALAYTVSKIDLAREGELGMPGFPAPQEAYAQVADVTAAQLGNAGLGLLMALVALLLVRPPAARSFRWAAIAVSWAGIAMVGAGAGVVGFGARAAGVSPSLGDTPPDMGTALAALVVGAVWVAGWCVAAVGAGRRRDRIRSGV